MRIGIIAPPWLPVPPLGYGGTEGVLDCLVRGLQAEGHEVLLATTGESTCPVPKVHVHERAVGIGTGDATAELLHVLHAYRHLKACDIVHDHTLVGPLYSKWFPDLQVVTTNHGPFDSTLTPLYRAIAPEVPIIAISHHQASLAKGIPIAAVIHHGIDVEEWPIGPGQGGYALFLGRLHPNKGAHVAARVARRAGIPLLIAAKCSEPAEKEYFEAAIRPQLGGGVEYLGEVNREAKAELLGDALCLLNPIAWPEPFGMVMVEAMACGTPVIATRSGAAPEIVDDGTVGYLCSSEDALVEALGKVASLERERCRSYVAERFSLKRMVRQHVRFYEELLDGSKRASLSSTLWTASIGPGAPVPTSAAELALRRPTAPATADLAAREAS